MTNNKKDYVQEAANEAAEKLKPIVKFVIGLVVLLLTSIPGIFRWIGESLGKFTNWVDRKGHTFTAILLAFMVVIFSLHHAIGVIKEHQKRMTIEELIQLRQTMKEQTAEIERIRKSEAEWELQTLKAIEAAQKRQ